jgi:hypothetical protein
MQLRRARHASRFAVTGLGAVKGATEMLAAEIKKLAGAVFGGVPPGALELADGGVRSRRARIPSSRSWRAARSSAQLAQACRRTSTSPELPLRLPAAVRGADVEKKF